MSIADRIIYQPPTEERISVERPLLEGTVCPSCGSTDVRRYPIVWSRGPRMVTKCQACFTTLSVEEPKPEDAWPPFRAVAYDWEVSPAERPNAIGGR